MINLILETIAMSADKYFLFKNSVIQTLQLNINKKCWPKQTNKQQKKNQTLETKESGFYNEIYYIWNLKLHWLEKNVEHFFPPGSFVLYANRNTCLKPPRLLFMYCVCNAVLHE